MAGLSGCLLIPTLTHGTVDGLNVFHVVMDVSSTRVLGAWMVRYG